MANLSYGVSGSSYYDLCRQGQVFAAYAANITTPVVYSTAAGTGGPLLWNGSTNVYAVILGVSVAVTTAETTTAIALGLTGNSAQTAAPSSTTPITKVNSLLIGGNLPACTAYNVGTPSSAGSFFLPLTAVGTGALTVSNDINGLVDVAGSVVVPPQSWVSVAASGTGTATLVAQIGLIWAEVVRR